MAVIYTEDAQSFWAPLRPRPDEACFLCGKPLVTDNVVVQEGSAGLINGVGHHAKRQHLLYLHARCAEQLSDRLRTDARTITYRTSHGPRT